MRLALLHMLPQVADVCGVAPRRLLERAGLAPDEELTTDVVVARAQICTVLGHLARETGEATVGLDLAAAANPAHLGLVGQALFSGRTLRECLAALDRQMPDLQSGVTLHLDERNGTARWTHRLADSDPEHARVLNEGISAFMARAITAVSGMPRDHLATSLPHRALAPTRVYEDKLGAPVTFGHGDGIALTFDATWLDRPNPLVGQFPASGGPRPPALLAQDAGWEDEAALLAVIHRLFASAALSGSLSLLDTARSLGAAPRTLQRRLSGLGTSFEAELDAWRRVQARQHLAQNTLPVSSVARALGYGHPAHFIRAFRRWEGTTPLSFRQAAVCESG